MEIVVVAAFVIAFVVIARIWVTAAGSGPTDSWTSSSTDHPHDLHHHLACNDPHHLSCASSRGDARSDQRDAGGTTFFTAPTGEPLASGSDVSTGYRASSTSSFGDSSTSSFGDSSTSSFGDPSTSSFGDSSTSSFGDSSTSSFGDSSTSSFSCDTSTTTTTTSYSSD